MPVILDQEHFESWLGQGGTDLLRPYPAAALVGCRVNPLVNSPRNDRPECLQPVA
jgi:putative SOS response-associated peptidase YedK